MRISLVIAMLSLVIAASLHAQESAPHHSADGEWGSPGGGAKRRSGGLVRLPSVGPGSDRKALPSISDRARVPDSLLITLTGGTKAGARRVSPGSSAPQSPAPVPPLGASVATSNSMILRTQGIEEIEAAGVPVVSEPDQLPKNSFRESDDAPVQSGPTDLKKLVEGFLFRGGQGGSSENGSEKGTSSGESQARGGGVDSPLSAGGTAQAGDGGGGTLDPQAATQEELAGIGESAGQLYWNPKAGPGEVALHADRASLSDILRLIADRHQMNLVIGPGVEGEITLALRDVHLEEALDAIAGVTGHTWFKRGNLLYVTSLAEGVTSNSAVQGRMVRVFPLNYITAVDAQTVATGLASPVGQIFIAESENENSQKTRDTLVVDDVPAAIERIAMYLAEVDQAPRQVLIETHIFQVVLDESNRHGVNLRPIARVGNGSMTLETLGFANENTAQGMKVTLDSTDFTSVIELIQANSNSRTLASPKILATDRQESNIQIGKRLSYLTTTTTQTASTQTVQFLDTGVVLTVKPIISADNQILMSISPKVSGGQLNAETNLPEEESTELKTTVLLPDGGGVIIGGLIKDEAVDNESRVPGFSRIPGIGWFFRRHETGVIKTEIIVALVAKIQDQPEMARPHEQHELGRTLPPYAATEMLRPSFTPIQMSH